MSTKIAVEDIVRITMGHFRGQRGEVLKIENGAASVRTSGGVAVISLHALEKVS